HRDLVLILAPRKPERFDVVAEKLRGRIGYVRRSALPLTEQTGNPPPVLLLDTIGELSGLFAAADVVFMGGTLARRGGHNILEPALFGKAIVLGPHMENFQAIADEFDAAGACLRIDSPKQLAGAVERLLDDSLAAREMGRRALAYAQARRGATARAISEIRQWFQAPRYRQAMPWFALLWVLARIWEWGGRRKQRRDSEHQR